MRLPPPLPWSRAGQSGRRKYTPPAQASWQSTALQTLLSSPNRPSSPLSGPLAVTIHAIFPRPKSLRSPGRSLVPSGRCDLDNVAKLVLDTVTRSRVWWVDDRHVASLTITRWYAALDETPHTWFEVSPMVDSPNATALR